MAKKSFTNFIKQLKKEEFVIIQRENGFTYICGGGFYALKVPDQFYLQNFQELPFPTCEEGKAIRGNKKDGFREIERFDFERVLKRSDDCEEVRFTPFAVDSKDGKGKYRLCRCADSVIAVNDDFVKAFIIGGWLPELKWVADNNPYSPIYGGEDDITAVMLPYRLPPMEAAALDTLCESINW